MDLQLRSKTCLVTGASRGIGRGAAKLLAAEGARMAMLARRALRRQVRVWLDGVAFPVDGAAMAE
jgi:3-oxoacyl-[acyl-carrier protein] reductase